MQLRIRAHDLPSDTRRTLERRIRLALGRHAAEIERAQVTLGSSRPGARCRIRARLRRGEDLAIEDRAADPSAAAEAAAWRLGQRLEHRRRGLLQQQTPRRHDGGRFR